MNEQLKFLDTLADKYSIWEWEAYPVAKGRLPPEAPTFMEWKGILDAWKEEWRPFGKPSREPNK